MIREAWQANGAPDNSAEGNTGSTAAKEAGSHMLSDALVDEMLDEVDAAYHALSPYARMRLKESVEAVERERQNDSPQ